MKECTNAFIFDQKLLNAQALDSIGLGLLLFMPTIKCLNSRIESNEKRRCLKFLAIIPLCLKDSLKSNPGEKLILRCPGCSSNVRWVAVYYEDGFVFQILEERPKFDENMKFDKIDEVEVIT